MIRFLEGVIVGLLIGVVGWGVIEKGLLQLVNTIHLIINSHS